MISKRRAGTVSVLFPGVSPPLIVGLVTYEALDNICYRNISSFLA